MFFQSEITPVSASISCFICTGFVRKAFIPQAAALSLSSLNTFAVIAIIGICDIRSFSRFLIAHEQSWDFGYGAPFTKEVRNEILESLAPGYINGLSLLGGEPFEPENQRELLPFIKNVKGYERNTRGRQKMAVYFIWDTI